MWQFFVFWWDCFCKAVSSAWSLAGALDLMLAITGIWLQNWAKTHGPDWLKARLTRLSKGHILTAAILMWFIPALFIFAPYWQFKAEHDQRLAAERTAKPQEIENLRKELDALQNKAKEENAREWPPLTPKQIAEWADALRPYHIQELDIFWGQVTDARKFFLSLKAVSKQADIPGFGAGLGGLDTPKEVLISVSKNNPAGPTLKRLFATLDCTVKLQEDRGESREILIYLGERP